MESSSGGLRCQNGALSVSGRWLKKDGVRGLSFQRAISLLFRGPKGRFNSRLKAGQMAGVIIQGHNAVQVLSGFLLASLLSPPSSLNRSRKPFSDFRVEIAAQKTNCMRAGYLWSLLPV